MHEIVENEYNRFLQDVKDGSMILGKYIDESEYIYEYSLNDIHKAANEFVEKVRVCCIKRMGHVCYDS